MIIDCVIPIARRLTTRSWPRSVAKTLTWRLFATLDSFVIAVLVTHNLKWAGSIVGIEALTKAIWYFLHERAWTRLPAAAPVQQAPSVARAAAPIVVSRATGRAAPTSFHRCLAVHLHYTANSGAMQSR